jgi:hypothetical protein
MLPQIVNVLGLHFHVREEPIESQPNGTKTFGYIDWVDGEIVIASNQMDDHKRICLLHEALHAVSDTGNIRLSETQITTMAFVLDHFLSDNPALLEMYDLRAGVDLALDV